MKAAGNLNDVVAQIKSRVIALNKSIERRAKAEARKVATAVIAHNRRRATAIIEGKLSWQTGGKTKQTTVSLPYQAKK